MVDYAIFAVCGALVATLLALLALPPVHRRAVRLTTRRLAGRLPMSVGEIVAAQDRLRAEHAMTLRAVERRAEASLVTAARERIEAGVARAAELDLKAKVADLNSKVADLEASGARIRGDLDRSGAAASAASQALEAERVARAAAQERLLAVTTAHVVDQRELARLHALLAEARHELAVLRPALAAKEHAEEQASLQLKAAASRIADADARRVAAERRLVEETAALVALRASLARGPEATPDAAAGPAPADIAPVQSAPPAVAAALSLRGRTTPLQQAAERARMDPFAKAPAGAH
jgi:hypothetical protein